VKINYLLERAANAWAIAGGLFILAIMLVTTANVALFGIDRLARIFGGVVHGLPGYEDFVSLAVSCAALMFLPLCQLRRGHVAVDVFAAKLPENWQDLVNRFWSLIACIAALFLCFWMALGMDEARLDNRTTPVLGWAIWPFFVPGILSTLLWAMIALTQAFERRADGRA